MILLVATAPFFQIRADVWLVDLGPLRPVHTRTSLNYEVPFALNHRTSAWTAQRIQARLKPKAAPRPPARALVRARRVNSSRPPLVIRVCCDCGGPNLTAEPWREGGLQNNHVNHSQCHPCGHNAEVFVASPPACGAPGQKMGPPCYNCQRNGRRGVKAGQQFQSQCRVQLNGLPRCFIYACVQTLYTYRRCFVGICGVCREVAHRTGVDCLCVVPESAMRGCFSKTSIEYHRQEGDPPDVARFVRR